MHRSQTKTNDTVVIYFPFMWVIDPKPGPNRTRHPKFQKSVWSVNSRRQKASPRVIEQWLELNIRRLQFHRFYLAHTPLDSAKTLETEKVRASKKVVTMEKVSAACAMEWSIKLEKALRSKNPGA